MKRKLVACLIVTCMLLTCLPLTAFGSTTLKVTSSGIRNGYIQKVYSYSGGNKSLPLKFSNLPADTKYIAVYMYDKNYNPASFVHWTAVNIKKTSSLKAGASNTVSMIQGKNGYGKNGYLGPDPPSTHTYVIKVYALKCKVNLSKGYSLTKFKKAIKGKVIASGSVTGKFKH